MKVLQFFITFNRTNNTNHATHHVKIIKKDERLPNAIATVFLQE